MRACSMNSGACLRLRFIFICLGLCLAGTVRATTFLTLQSTYLGDGWFQYQMDVMNDPFCSQAVTTGLSINFTNQIDQVGGANGWNYDSTNGWHFTGAYPTTRPYLETFLARSSETSYRLAPISPVDGAVLLSLTLNDMCPGTAEGVVSENVVGYA